MTAFDVLGVHPKATPAQIKAAYRAKAAKIHPDLPGGDHNALVLLNEAYEALKRGSTVLASQMSAPEKARIKAKCQREMKTLKMKEEIVEKRIVTWDQSSAAEIIRQMREPLVKERARLEAEMAAIGETI